MLSDTAFLRNTSSKACAARFTLVLHSFLVSVTIDVNLFLSLDHCSSVNFACFVCSLTCCSNFSNLFCNLERSAKAILSAALMLAGGNMADLKSPEPIEVLDGPTNVLLISYFLDSFCDFFLALFLLEDLLDFLVADVLLLLFLLVVVVVVEVKSVEEMEEEEEEEVDCGGDVFLWKKVSIGRAVEAFNGLLFALEGDDEDDFLVRLGLALSLGLMDVFVEEVGFEEMDSENVGAKTSPAPRCN